MTDLNFFAEIGVITRRSLRVKLAPVDCPVMRPRRPVVRCKQWRIVGRIGRTEEKRHAESIGLGIRKDAMQGGRVAVIRPDLSHVPDVDDERAASRRHEVPFAVAEHFGARLVVLQQDRQRAGVCVMIQPEMARLRRKNARWPLRLRARRIIIEPQKARMPRQESLEQPVRRTAV